MRGSPYGNIVTTVTPNPITGEPLDVSYQWVGPSLFLLSYYDAASLDLRGKLRPGDIFSVGPYRLRVIDTSDWAAAYVCRRDGAGAWVALYQTRVARVTRFVYHRLVATAAIWGLARWNRDAVPTWRDVHALRRIAAWLGR